MTGDRLADENLPYGCAFRVSSMPGTSSEPNRISKRHITVNVTHPTTPETASRLSAIELIVTARPACSQAVPGHSP